MNLLSAGCSLIYGAELSDSLSPVGSDPPSQKTWVSLYANSRNLNHSTVATCGISNQGIVRKVIEAVENNKINLIVVQWTYLNRFEVRWNDDTYQTFSYWHSKDFSTDNKLMLEYKNKNLNKCDLATLWFRNIYSKNTAYYYYIKSKVELENYLSFKKIPHVFLDSENTDIPLTDDIAISSLQAVSNNFNNLNFNGMGFYNWATLNRYPVGSESHPLDQAHSAAFDLIKHKLDEKFQLFEHKNY
jgi:hypothetical protein